VAVADTGASDVPQPPALPGRDLQHGTVYEFEMSVRYLLALVFFPLLGAGLGAWEGSTPQAARASGQAVAVTRHPTRLPRRRAEAYALAAIASQPFRAATCTNSQSQRVFPGSPGKKTRRRVT